MNEPVYWIDPYAKKTAQELDSHATCVIDGWAWRISPDLKTYCAGKVENLKGVERETGKQILGYIKN